MTLAELFAVLPVTGPDALAFPRSLPDFVFDRRTDCATEAEAWMDRKSAHLARHAVLVR